MKYWIVVSGMKCAYNPNNRIDAGRPIYLDRAANFEEGRGQRPYKFTPTEARRLAYALLNFAEAHSQNESSSRNDRYETVFVSTSKEYSKVFGRPHHHDDTSF